MNFRRTLHHNGGVLSVVSLYIQFECFGDMSRIYGCLDTVLPVVELCQDGVVHIVVYCVPLTDLTL